MNRKYLQSSNLLAVRYQPYTGVLEVAFHDGHVYQYFKVPAKLYSELMHASSHGSFFNYNIRRQFPFRKVR
jgi:hypothetical protein